LVYVASRPHAPQLPPIQSNMSADAFNQQSATAQLNAMFGREARSPRHQPAPQQTNPGSRGAVPKFTKCLNISDLQPQINTQPAFRRANPEGGFISVCSAKRTLYCVYAKAKSLIAIASTDHTSPRYLSDMQSQFQIRVL